MSIGIYLLLMTQLDRTAVFAGILWCLIGLLLFFICRRVRKPPADSFSPPLPAPPQGQEKQKLDREFCIWCTVVGAAVLLVLGLHLSLFL